MEEKKLELFIDYLIKFGFLTGISINEFVTNYNKQNTKNSFSKIKNENNFINEIFLTEDFIHDYFYIMNAVPVQMNPDGPFP